VIPDDLERSYGGVPEIAEVAVLEDKGALVAWCGRSPSNCASVG
jgi:hypothetical protein